jgi:hypothetical protein
MVSETRLLDSDRKRVRLGLWLLTSPHQVRLESRHDAQLTSDGGLEECANECAPKGKELRIVGRFMRSTVGGCNSNRGYGAEMGPGSRDRE